MHLTRLAGSWVRREPMALFSVRGGLSGSGPATASAAPRTESGITTLGTDRPCGWAEAAGHVSGNGGSGLLSCHHTVDGALSATELGRRVAALPPTRRRPSTPSWRCCAYHPPSTTTSGCPLRHRTATI